MAAGRVGNVIDLSRVHFEVLRSDDEFILHRGQGSEDLSRVLVLAPTAQYPRPGSLKRLEHECSLKQELDPAWAARPIGLARHWDRPALVLEDPGGTPLDQLLGSVRNDFDELSRAASGTPDADGYEPDHYHVLTPRGDLAFCLHVAINLATAIGHLHRRGMVHKDIKPANVLVNLATGQVWLMGFGIASRLPRQRPAPEPPEFIAGTLAYMAPEQTGRMNRSVDSRSDLYSFGVTLYQMFTGSLSFTAVDAIEWVHCHIARQPEPPAQRAERIPETVSAIIMKLLAKTAEERYQTAAGLERDLRRCLGDWETRGRIDEFPLGERDRPDRLLIPEKLYGRAREIDMLLASFDRVVTTGSRELMLVSGYSGVGKSSVVNELHTALVPKRGLFASGKFDQHKRDIPYSTLAKAFQSLIRPLLGKSEAELADWRHGFQEALGANAGLIVDLVPELKLIMGEQPPVPELPRKDAQRRFQLVFRRFVSVFACREHPLALFLDDLQWLDAATLDLLEDLSTQPDVHYLMLLGAYRDNEVSSAHPLMHKLEAIRKAGTMVQEITLVSLAREDLGWLIADSLRSKPERVRPLAQLVHEKTDGNPFFAIQFISALAEEGLLTFEHDYGRWCWDLNHIHAKGYTDNVVDLMVGKLSRLPVETQEGLRQLACLGNVAEITTLSIVLGAEEKVHLVLWEAVRQELIVRLEDSYRFIHDRVQEAAYSLIPEGLRPDAHLRIGRLLVAYTPPERREEAVFGILSQLNRGTARISSPDEREQLAELNLIAAKRAKASTAYASALKYLATGAALLAEGCWSRRHELAFLLEINRAECEFLTGELAAADGRLTTLSMKVANTVERAAVACLRVDLYMALDQGSRAIVVGLDYLRHLGIEWSPHPTQEEGRREYEGIWSQLGSRTIEELVDLPLMSDPESLATLDLLTKLVPPAMFTDANLASLVICRAVNLSLERGNHDGSCLAYVMLGMVAGAGFGEYQAAFRFGQLGYDLVERRGLKRFQARTYMNFANVVLLWTRHVKARHDLLRHAFEAANKIGDLTYAGYASYMMITNLLAAGDPLAEVQREAEEGLAFAQKTQFGLVIDIISTQLALIRTLRGLTPKLGSFDNEQFEEVRIERRFSGNPDLARAECWYWIRKLQARFFAGDYASALDASSRAQRLLWTSPSVFETAEYHFYSALCHAGSCGPTAACECQYHGEALTGHHRQLEVWAENCLENFENRAALVGAEIARIEGREFDAERLYEQAIHSAHENGFVHNEALASELAGRFYAARKFEKIARVYLWDARDGYLRWGAAGKVRQLEELYPHLREEGRTSANPVVPARPLASCHEPVSAPTSTIGTPVEQLDLATVIKVSQAISSEIVLEKLIHTLMRIALEEAGAERGLLILARGNELRIEAEALLCQGSGGQTSSDRDKVTVHFRRAVVPARNASALADAGGAPSELPESLLRYAIRTRESVTLSDASAENFFSEDEYIRRKRPRSVFCLPLIKQGKLVGVLYLENNLAAGVFTSSRLAILELIASQAAISLEQARLYAELSQENSERKKAEEALRASEERLQAIIDHSTAVIFVKDLDLKYLLVNREFERRHRVRRDEIRGKSDSDIHPREVAEALRANDRRVIEAGEPRQFEEVVPSVDGKRVCLAVKFLLRDRTAKPYAVCGIATDITDLKRTEELEAEMAHERELFLEEKTRLAGEIHDSLAQSFTGITMQLEMAKEVITEKDNQIIGYVERANDLARFGLAEARRSVLSLQPMIIKDAGLIDSLQRLVERSNIPGRLRCTFRSNLADDESLPVVVRQDLLRIAQEAISNALRHAKSTAISVSLRSDPPDLILKVKDNGSGLTTEAEAREGFGFVNMRARVKKLKGSLDIRSAPGRGTSIVVCVPLNAS